MKHADTSSRLLRLARRKVTVVVFTAILLALSLPNAIAVNALNQEKRGSTLTLEQVCQKHNIGHVYVMSLDAFSPENTNVAQLRRKLIHDYGLAEERLRLIDAVNGQALGDRELAKRVGGLLASFANSSKQNKGISRGEIGTALTHVSVWETIQKEGLEQFEACRPTTHDRYGQEQDEGSSEAPPIHGQDQTRTCSSGLDETQDFSYRAIVLEDDPTFTDQFVRRLDDDLSEMQFVDPSFHWLYLSRRPLFPQYDKPTPRPHILRPAYSYWANAYVLTARGAAVLLRHRLLDAVIPVDEFVPIVTGSHWRLDWMRYFGVPVDMDCGAKRLGVESPQPLGVCVSNYAPLKAYAVTPNLITQNFQYDADGFVVSANDNATDAQQQLYTMKQDTTPRHAVSLTEVITFQTRGWVKLEGVLPELSSTFVQLEARKAHSQTLRSYVSYSVSFLTDRYGVQLSSDLHLSSCGPLDMSALEEMSFENTLERLGPDEANKLLTPLLSRLRCSVELENKLRGTKEAVEKGPSLPYFQALNLHRLSPVLHRIATETSLGRIAAILLQSPSIRLYQTALFCKDDTEALNRPTAWHRDLGLIPLDTKAGGQLTLWCPLDRDIGLEDSALVFASGSHRDLSLQYWYPDMANVDGLLRERYQLERVGSLRIGDCTAHHGWVYHEAPKQPLDRVGRGFYRRAVAFSFVTSDAMPLPDLEAKEIRKGHRVFDREDEMSYDAWINEVEPFQPIDHPLLPVVFTDKPIVIS